MAGTWIETNRSLEVRNKYSGEVVDHVPLCDVSVLESALRSAERGAHTMKGLPAYRRAEILEQASDEIKRSEDELAKTIAVEAGKPMKYSRKEVERARLTMKFSSEEAKRVSGEVIPFDAEPRGVDRVGYYFRVPVGVVGAITPFNDPLNLVAHKLGPAFAGGNSVILKPASVAPLSALNLASILDNSGLPSEALNVVVGAGKEVGEPLVSDRRVGMVSFTGGVEAGRRIAQLAGIKRVSMELGSNSAVIVMDDAPLDLSVSACCESGFSCQGQNCIHPQRLYVQEGVYREFEDDLVEGVERLVLGDPLDMKTDVGPMISEAEAARVEEWVHEAVEQGATVLTGGTRDGVMFWPTVLRDVPAGARIAREEVFGPVVLIERFGGLEEAIEKSNSTGYGLQAGIFTSSIDSALRAVRDLEFGAVLVNDTSDFRVDFMPFGGVKMSGVGREGVKFAIEEMTEIKTVIYRTSG